MAYLTKADFLAGITLKPQDLEIDGLGTVQVRGLGLAEMNEIRAAIGDNELLLVVHGAHRGLVNPQLSLEDLALLGQANPLVVSEIGKKVFEISGMGQEVGDSPLAGGGS